MKYLLLIICLCSCSPKLKKEKIDVNGFLKKLEASGLSTDANFPKGMHIYRIYYDSAGRTIIKWTY